MEYKTQHNSGLQIRCYVVRDVYIPYSDSKKRMKNYSLLLLCTLIALLPVKAQGLEEVRSFGKLQPVGVAMSKKGRLFVSFPKWTDNYAHAVVEVLPNGKLIPFPNPEWNRWDTARPQDHFLSVQALFIDRSDAVWALDLANPTGMKPIRAGIKLVKLTLDGTVERVYRFDDLPGAGLNDVQVDAGRQVAYLSDPGRSAVVVLDLKTGKSRTLLQGDVSTKADPNTVLSIDGKDVRDQAGRPFSSNVNGIALTHDGQYFYFRPITKKRLYRIQTKFLYDPAYTAAQVSAAVEDLGEAGFSHGMIADAAGNVYMGDSQEQVIRRRTPAGKLETLVQDKRIHWPDSYAIGPDGYLYVTMAQLDRAPRYHDGTDRVVYPYWLYRIKL